MAWTEDRVELLKKLWGDGYSASQIAAQLGEVTRNAVIGKAHRLGLSGRQSTRPAAPRSGAASQSAAQRRPAQQPTGQAPQVGATSTSQTSSISAVSQTVVNSGGAARKLDIRASLDTQTADDLALAPTPLRVIDGNRPGTVTLLDLKERMCKWPIGDPGDENFRFCGGKATPGQPYCDDHCAMAFQPSTRSRERKG